MKAKRNRLQRRRNLRRLGLQPLEARRVLAASLGWDGPGLGSAELTYYIANSPASLSQSETNAAIETALEAWSNVADIQFTPTTQPGLRDSLDISFRNIDGPGGTLAQAYFPDDVNPARIAGDIQFDISEVWEVGNTLGRQAFDLVWVAAHEVGHALGLDHINVAGSVLAPFVSPNQSFSELSSVDVNAIQDLYRAADPTTTVPDQNDANTSDDPAPDDNDGSADNDDPSSRGRWWRLARRWWRFGGRLEADVPEHHNLYNPTDVNGDDVTSALDALMVINHLAGADTNPEAMCDTNGDGSITALDALTVINAMGSRQGEFLADEAVDDESDESDESDDAESPLDELEQSDDDTNTDDDDADDPVDHTDDDIDAANDADGDDHQDEEVNDVETDEEDDGDTDNPDDPVAEQEDDTNTVDDSNDSTEPVDDGGLTHDGDADEDDHPHRNRRFANYGGLLGKSSQEFDNWLQQRAEAADSEGIHHRHRRVDLAFAQLGRPIRLARSRF